MLLRSDDAVRRLRAVWLGPDKKRLPVDWTYVAWATFALLVLVLTPMLTVGLWLVTHRAVLAAAGGPGFAGLVSYHATKALMDVTDVDRPVRYWRRSTIGELRRCARRVGPVNPAGAAITVTAGVVAVVVATVLGLGFVLTVLLAAVVMRLAVVWRSKRSTAGRGAHLDRQAVTVAGPVVTRLTPPTVSHRKAAS